jgi:hypothetical protein
MVTLRNKFHELGNWHNKISMGAIVTREALADKDITELSPQEAQKIVAKAIKTLGQIEEFIMGADAVVDEIKPFIYSKVDGDRDISQKEK